MKWISIKWSRAPVNTRALFAVEGDPEVYYGLIDEYGAFYACDFEFPYGLDSVDEEPTHWMPLPEPPKE